MEKIIVAQAVGWTDIINVFLVLALVGITAFYAWRTHNMVQEMRKTRHSQLMPKLKLGILHLGPTFSVIRISNVGSGPALNVQLKLWFGAKRDNQNYYTSPVMTVGEDVQFLFPKKPDGNYPNSDEFAEIWQTITMKARYFDALDKEYKIEETLNFKEYWEKTKSAGVRVQEDNLKEIEKNTKEIADQIKDISGSIKSLKS
jgi:hypothetical protein